MTLIVTALNRLRAEEILKQRRCPHRVFHHESHVADRFQHGHLDGFEGMMPGVHGRSRIPSAAKVALPRKLLAIDAATAALPSRSY